LFAQDAQVVTQKTIIWIKKPKKGKHEWEKVCHEIGM
jgi:hypothetical protein